MESLAPNTLSGKVSDRSEAYATELFRQSLVADVAAHKRNFLVVRIILGVFLFGFLAAFFINPFWIAEIYHNLGFFDNPSMHFLVDISLVAIILGIVYPFQKRYKNALTALEDFDEEN